MTQPETPDPALPLAKLIASLFVERHDVKAIQTKTGAYMPVRQDMRDTASPTIPFGLRDLIDHINGVKTYGHYLVSQAGTCRTFVFDIDLRSKANTDRGEEPIMFQDEEINPREVWAGPVTDCKKDLQLQLRVMAEQLARQVHKILAIKTLVSYSGSKGMHVYGCLDPGTPAHDAREVAGIVFETLDGLIVPEHGKNFFKHATAFPALSIELFPKQDEVREDGFGNLIRLPLGKNQKSGKNGFFMDMSTPIDQPKIDDPLIALTEGSIR